MVVCILYYDMHDMNDMHSSEHIIKNVIFTYEHVLGYFDDAPSKDCLRIKNTLAVSLLMLCVSAPLNQNTL